MVLKIMAEPHPPPERLGRFRREYAIAAELPPESVVQPLALAPTAHGHALVMPDHDGVSLDRIVGQRQLSPVEATGLALGVARALARVHGHGVIHKDISPANILADPDLAQVRLIDFGLSSQLAHEEAHAAPATALEGTLSYIAPEQTGRLNRGVDHRADFYGLGATFFELLTGEPPFRDSDALALVHAHLALQPPDAASRRADVPAALDRVLARLLAKTPEERYQSAAALIADLAHCHSTLSTSGHIPNFTPGRGDIPLTLHLPQTLYGREQALAQLTAGFETAAQGGRALTLVAGDPGTGKSALVRELYRPATAHQAYFIAGKYEQLGADQPYAAVVAALDGLIRQLLAESETALAGWREQLTQTLGDNLAVLAQLLPSITDIIGPQPAPPALGADAERYRFAYTLRRFLATVARPAHPLVLVLDDLQWADGASLALLQQLLTDPEITAFHVVGAYRPGELDSAHPVMTLAHDVTANGGRADQLELTGMSEDAVAAFIADTLWTSPAACAQLAQAAYRKTLGNPFFLERLVARWYSEGLLWPDTGAGTWRWDMAAIAESSVADNVVAFMTDKLGELPETTLDVLPLAAVLGASFDLAKLSVVAETSPAACLETLWPALEADILRPVDEQYKYVGAPGHAGHAQLRFVHDKVQEAALARLDQAAERQARLTVGRLLLADVADPDTDPALLEALGQLDRVRTSVTDPDEQLKLARLHVTAAQRARRAVAFERLRDFTTHGLALLGEAPWQRDYATWLALQQLEAEAALLLKDWDTFNAISASVFAHARTVIDTTPLRLLRIYGYNRDGSPDAGLREGLASLRALGVKLPEKPRKLRLLASYALTRRVLARHSAEAQLASGPINDPVAAARASLLAATQTPALATGKPVAALVTFNAVRDLWRFGNLGAAAGAVPVLGNMVIKFGEPVATARHYCDVGRALVDKFEDEALKGHATVSTAYGVAHWDTPLPDLAEKCRRDFQESRQQGDLSSAGLHAALYVLYMAYGDVPLDRAYPEAERYCAWVSQAWNRSGSLRAVTEFLAHLHTDMDTPERLVQLGSDEETFLRELEAIAESNGIKSTVTAMLELALHFRSPGRIDWLLTWLHAYADPSLGDVMDMRAACVMLWVEGLRRPQNQAPGRRRRRWLARHLARLDKALTRIPAAATYRSWVELGRGEIRRLEDDAPKALAAYNAAIEAATQQGQRIIAGLARERAADLLLAQGQNTVAQNYLRDAAQNAEAAAAHGKLAFLQRYYGLALSGSGQATPAATSATMGSWPSTTSAARSTGTSTGERELDWVAVLRAAQSLSQEIRPDALIEQVMRTVAQTAGATHGCLLLIEPGETERAANLHLWARFDVTAEADIETLDGTPVGDAGTAVPRHVLRYVLRTRDMVALDEPANSSTYGSDPYLQAHKPRSLLALPLVNQGRLSGVLYLENRQSSGAFPESRTTLLSLLSAQIAISIENARLYATMEDQVARRTRELEAEKSETERAHRVIQDSLENARRMQRATLPQPTPGELGLADLAVWWQPRDQVGGDCYRLTRSADGRYLAAVLMDCTGHGVPGALISFIATSAADRALAAADRWEPVTLLAEVDALVRSELHGRRSGHETSPALSDDGLEAGMAIIDTRTGEVAYAGAGIHLFHDSGDDVALVRGARGALGYCNLAAPADLATTHLRAQAGGDLFLATDGILEQTGGPKGLQLGRKRFARLLADARGAGGLGDRLSRIQASFARWQGETVQRDDLTLIALRPAAAPTDV